TSCMAGRARSNSRSRRSTHSDWAGRTPASCSGASINRTPRQRTIIPSGYPPIPAIHLAIRFLLEIAMLVGVGMAGWHIWRYAGAILFVAGTMALWGIFGTPADVSRGAAIVPTPGQFRLLLEIALFGIAAYG